MSIRQDPNPTAGIGDPYWYEWSVGISYIIEMFDEDSPIVGVTLQSPTVKVLDDVVVREALHTRFIQVKHTRTQDALTFGDLLSRESSGENGKTKQSLLEKLSASWLSERNKAPDSQLTVTLHTNRDLGTIKVNSGYLRPPLSDFWKLCLEQRSTAVGLCDFVVPPDWAAAWSEFLAHIQVGTDENRLLFLKNFEIEAGQPDLDKIAGDLLRRLQDLLAISPAQAQQVMESLYSALRTWATSLRGCKEEVDRAELFRKISLDSGANTQHGDHFLPPPAPFHESRLATEDAISDALKRDDLKVVFLTGSPGSGKTSLISHLLNQRNSLIDLRYFAFKPLSSGPTALEDRLATPEVLWGDLLCQLREILRNRLHEFKLPVRNDFLNSEQRKQELLRACSAFGKHRGEAVVIAIDGLDHAARSRRLRPDLPGFLSSLPDPADVPPYVKFLVAGQPDYSDYPRWLVNPDPKLGTVIVLPPLKSSDVRSLLVNRGPQFTDIDLASEVIQEVCKGNTLATHFAVEEACQSANIAALAETLSNRKLVWGLQGYYDHLWNAATAKAANVSHKRLAALLSVVEEPIPPDFLSAVVDTETGKIQALDALRGLRPLVTECDGKFTVYHNDFRVHLSVVIADAPELREVSGRLADYLCESGTNLIAKHKYLLRLLELSGRQSEFPSRFTPEWVIEGWVGGSTYEALVLEARCVARILSRHASLQFADLHKLACSIDTVLQLSDCLEWSQEEQRHLDRVKIPAQGFFSSELAVLDRSCWNFDILIGLAREAKVLCELDLKDRALALLNRWFKNTKLDELLPDPPSRQKRNNDGQEEYRQAFEKAQRFCRELGACWFHLRGQTLEFPRCANYAASLMTGLIDKCLEKDDWSFLRMAFASGKPIFTSDIENALDRAVDLSRWTTVAYILSTDVGPTSPYLQLKYCAYSILAGVSRVQQLWLEPLCNFNVSDLGKYGDNPVQGDLGLESLCFAAFIAPFGGLPSEARQRASSKLAQLYPQTYALVLRSASILGEWLRAIRCGCAYTELGPEEFQRLCGALLAFNGERHSSRMPSLCCRIVKGLCWCAETSSTPYQRAALNVATEILNSRRRGDQLKFAWNLLKKRRNFEPMRECIDYWLNPESGQLWAESATHRSAIFREIEKLADRSVAIPLKAKEMTEWGCVQYSLKDEQALSSALTYFENLVELNPTEWTDSGLQLLCTSDSLPADCDNRLDHMVLEAVVAAALRCGPQEFLRFLKSHCRGGPLYVGSSIVDGILQGLEGQTLSSDDAVGIWALGMGLLTWRVDNDTAQIQELYDLLVSAAATPEPVLVNLESLSPYEVERCRKRAFVDKDRRYVREPGVLEAEVSIAPFQAALEIVEQHIRKSGASRGDAWRAIASLFKRLRYEAPPNFNAILSKLRELLVLRDASHPWYFDDAEEAFDQLIPLLDDTELNEFSRQVLKDLESVESGRTWLGSLSRNLGRHCIARARNSGFDELKDGLSRELGMHRTWLTGLGRLPLRGQTLKLLPLVLKSCVTWAEVGFEILLGHLAAKGVTTVATALQGLYLLAQQRPTLLASFDTRWLELADDVQEYLLLLAEQWARKRPEHFDKLSGWLRLAYEGPAFGPKLQAWVVYRTRELITGEPVPPMCWNAITPSHLERLERPVYSVGQSKTFGLQRFASEHSAAQKILTNLGLLTDLDTSMVLHEMGYFRVKVEPVEKPTPERRGDYFLKGSNKVSILMHVVHSLLTSDPELCPVSALAAALCPGDEPEILFCESPRVVHAGTWVSESVLEERDNVAIEKELEAVASSNLPQNCALLACEIRAYTRDLDYVYNVDARWRKVHFLVDANRPPRTLLGRCFTFYDRYPGSVSEGYGLTNRTAGLVRLDAAALWLVLDEGFAQRLGWSPSPERPLEWVREKRKVVWLERVAGNRGHYPLERFHRVPMMQRWVILSDELERARKILGGYLHLGSSLGVAKYPGRE